MFMLHVLELANNKQKNSKLTIYCCGFVLQEDRNWDNQHCCFTCKLRINEMLIDLKHITLFVS